MVSVERPDVVDSHGLPTRVLRSPGQLRALAHPRRLQILDLLLTEGPLTATECAGRLEDSAASCSYHLRQLARHGFVREALGGQGRNRPWERVPLGNQIHRSSGPEEQAAAQALSAVIDAHNADRIRDYLRHRAEDPWQESAAISDWSVRLTEEELVTLGSQIAALVSPLQARTFAGRAPAGARTVDVLTYLMPRPAAAPTRQERSPGDSTGSGSADVPVVDQPPER